MLDEKNIVIREISKRIDGVEGDILKLRERTHDLGTTQMSTAFSIERINDICERVMDSHEKISAKLIDNQRENAAKFEEIEKITTPIRLIRSGWKPILWTIIISAVIGFSFETGIRDMLKIAVGSKLGQAQAILSNG